MTLSGNKEALLSRNNREDAIRRRIIEAINSLPEKTNLKRLSLMLGRNHAYLQQYLHRGSPRALPEELRYQLAELLDIDERDLSPIAREPAPDADGLHAIRFLDHPSLQREKHRHWMIPASSLEDIGITNADTVRVARNGDNTPDLVMKKSDMVILDTADTSPSVAGFFAIDIGDHIRVRHLEQNPSSAGGGLIISHDSTMGYTLLDEELPILGRVLYHFRLLAPQLS